MKNKIYLFASSTPGEAKTLSGALAYEGSRRFFAAIGKEPCRIEKLPSGKPVFRGGEYFLSISHSGGAFLGAYGEIPLGVDLEKREKPRKGVAAKYFSPEERKQDFFSVWTKKEALAKLVGEGLSAMGRILTAEKTATLSGESYFLFDLSVDFPQKGFAAALAAQSDEIEMMWL